MKRQLDEDVDIDALMLRDAEAKQIIDEDLEPKRSSSQTINAAVNRFMTARAGLLSAKKSQSDVFKKLNLSLNALEYESARDEILSVRRPGTKVEYIPNPIPADIAAEFRTIPGYQRGFEEDDLDYKLEDDKNWGAVAYRDSSGKLEGFWVIGRGPGISFGPGVIARAPGLRNTNALKLMFEEVKKQARDSGIDRLALNPTTKQSRHAYLQLGYKDLLFTHEFVAMSLNGREVVFKPEHRNTLTAMVEKAVENYRIPFDPNDPDDDPGFYALRKKHKAKEFLRIRDQVDDLIEPRAYNERKREERSRRYEEMRQRQVKDYEKEEFEFLTAEFGNKN